jgi:leader peptidase (prepilin peptidase) / N-methyltransferase
MMPLVVRLVLLWGGGALLGSLVNWAIYTLAWHPRAVSPWSPPLPDAPPRHWTDRLPIVGWFGLRREAALHGRGFWVRPLLLELCLGVAVAALHWWEIDRLGLVRDQLAAGLAPPLGPLYWQFASHVILLCWMLAASLIDIDEKIIPDEITVTGVLLGLVLATLVPMSLLPDVAERVVPPVVGEAIILVGGQPAAGPRGQSLWLEPVTAVAPAPWRLPHVSPQDWPWLLVALACYWLWCFALAPRIWRGRRGSIVALKLIAARLWRECRRQPLAGIITLGTVAICAAWVPIGAPGRVGLLTSLVGLVVSGGMVWAVRLIGTAALKREAMGFGDVTLMMMVGAFLGWQAGLIAFFLAPFAGLVVGIAQLVFRRDDVIPYGPFLCLGTAAVVVAWAPIWNWARPIFQAGLLVPVVLAICLVLLGVLLLGWRLLKTALIGRSA